MEKTIPGADTKILDPALRELIASSSDDEQAILRSILVAGVDQGWFCRAESEDLLNPSPGEIENLLEVVGKRPDVDPSDADPWDDQGPPPAPISGDEPGWVILSQRCDLIRAYRQEPLVEVARAATYRGGRRADRTPQLPALGRVCRGPR